MNTPEIPAPVRELLAALVDAFDLPLPDITDGAERAYHRVLAERARTAHATLRIALATGPEDFEHGAAYLRRRVAEIPADYRPWPGPQDAAEGGEGR
ncbi:hypothetical protein SUDANB106_01517 [Streptomyces sp. enrichment culture]|uniref:hypothetical protein n=1 Tax=Streptomyces sp. enrichment culture TaxID=1795815 RepID=UPI003F56A4BC